MENIENFLSERRTKIEINEYKDKIVDYLKSNFIPPTTTKREQFESWFEGYFKNYLFNNRIDFMDKDFENDLLHKIDYLNSAQAKKRFDRMTWDVLEKQVDNWEGWVRKRAEKGDDPQGTELAAQLSDNWSAVELKSAKSLSYEGGVMGHCVGSYHDKVAGGRTKIFSLRDKKDNSHVTIEYNINNNEIVQIQGKENKLPKDAYHKYIFEFASANRLMFSSSMMSKFKFKQLGYEYLPPGKVYEEKLQDYLKMGEDYNKGGVLDLRGENCNDMSISGVWDTVRIDGDTNVGGLKNLKSSTIELSQCSENINFDNVETQNLSIKSSLISDLKGMDVKNNLVLVGTFIKEIPAYDLKSLKIKGTGSFSVLEKCSASSEILHIDNAPFLKEIKKGHYDYLHLESTGITSLEGVSAKDLKLINSPKIKNLDFNTLENGEFYNIGIESLENLELEGKGKLEFSGCGNLTKVSNIKGKEHRIKLNHNPNLKEISGLNVAFLDLRRNVNIEKMEKVRAHSANFSDIDFNKVKTRRINLRKISTNNPDILRTRKLNSLSNR